MNTHIKTCFSWGEIERLHGKVAKPFKIQGTPAIIKAKFSFFQATTTNIARDLSLSTFMHIFLYFNMTGNLFWV